MLIIVRRNITHTEFKIERPGMCSCSIDPFVHRNGAFVSVIPAVGEYQYIARFVQVAPCDSALKESSIRYGS